MSFSKEEIQRYARQILCFGKDGQQKLSKAKVCIIGAGGIGSPLLQYLVAAGVGHIYLFEHDVVDASNLARQILFNAQDIGLPKGAVAINRLKELNPFVKVQWINEKFDPENALSYTGKVDLLLDGCDDLRLKISLAHFSITHKIMLLTGAISARQAHIFPTPFVRENFTGCYQCFFPPMIDYELIPSCASEGINSPLAGIIGSYMAYLTTHYLVYDQWPNSMYLWEGINLRQKNLGNFQPRCKLCR